MMESSINFPDLVLDKILRLIPTKPAVQTCLLSKQLHHLPSSLLALDFDEHDHFERNVDHLIGSSGEHHHQYLHLKFIDFLEGYRSFRAAEHDHLEKLRIHTRMFSVHDDRESVLINRWLLHAWNSVGLKELDICLDFCIKPCLTLTEHLVETETPVKSEFYDDFDPFGLLLRPGKTLTSLKLGCVTLLELLDDGLIDGSYPATFPSLKTLSLKAARFWNYESSYALLLQCPLIEHLSLTYCSFDEFKLYVCPSTLKSFEVKYCDVNEIRVDKAFNLESFSFVSARDAECDAIILNSTFKLKHIDVSVDKNIGVFSILGCHPALEASIKSKKINEFELFDGYLSAKFSFIANHDYQPKVVDYATILVWEQMDKVGLMSSEPTYIPMLVSFIKSFSCCKDIIFYNEAFRALTIPRSYRIMSSRDKRLLPLTSGLEVRAPNWVPQLGYTEEYDELLETLKWLAPKARPFINTMGVVMEREREIIDERARRDNRLY